MIEIEEIKKTLALSTLPQIGNICVFDARTINFDGGELLTLPEKTAVFPFVFECEKRLFAGVLTNFVLENTAKSADPFSVENEIADTVKEIGLKIGLVNAKPFNPVKDSTAEVEGLPVGTGDCFIFAF